MSGIFGGSMPKPQAPQPVPQIDEARRAQQLRDEQRLRSGRAATVLTGQLAESAPKTGAKKLGGA